MASSPSSHPIPSLSTASSSSSSLPPLPQPPPPLTKVKHLSPPPPPLHNTQRPPPQPSSTITRHDSQSIPPRAAPSPPPGGFLAGSAPLHSDLPFFPPLLRDHEAILKPDYKTPFLDARDVVARLLPYHIWQVPEDVIRLAKGYHKRSVNAKGKQRVLDNPLEPAERAATTMDQTSDRKRKRTASNTSRMPLDDDITLVPRVEKAGQSSLVSFERIEGLDFPQMQDLDSIIPRFQDLRSAVRRLRHRVTGGEKAVPSDGPVQVSEPAPSIFAKEAHLQLLRLACSQDRAELEQELTDLREARSNFLAQYGQHWQSELDEVAPGLIATAPLPPPHTEPAPSSVWQANNTSNGKGTSDGMQTWPVNSRSTSPQRGGKRPASPNNKKSGPWPGTPSSGGGPGSRGPYRKKQPSAQQQQQQQQQQPQQQAQYQMNTPNAALARPPITPKTPVGASQASLALPAAPQGPIRIILPLSLIGSLTAVGIAPLPAPHLQPAIEAHKRRAAAAEASGSAVPSLGESSKAEAGDWTTAPCEPDPDQTEPAILLGITEAEAPGGKGEWHQLVHLSLLLSRLDSSQLTALAEVVATVQTQSGGNRPQANLNGTSGPANGTSHGVRDAGDAAPSPTAMIPPVRQGDVSLPSGQPTAAPTIDNSASLDKKRE